MMKLIDSLIRKTLSALRNVLPKDRNTALGQALALGVGGIGALVFLFASMPLPWMLGSMFACALAAAFNLPVLNPGKLRNLMVPIIGVALGSSLSPDALGAMQTMAVGFGVLMTTLLSTALLTYPLYRSFGGFNKKTALFSAMPGGLAEMVIMSEGTNVDISKVAMIHAVRIFVVVLLVPLWFRYSEHITYVSGQIPRSIPLSAVTTESMLLLVGLAVIGTITAARLRLPSAPLIGPLLLCGALQLAGLTRVQPISELVAMAQLVLGASIGSRMKLAASREAAITFSLAFVGAVILIAAAMLAVWITVRLGSLPLHVVVLSFAPGGIAEMALIALALGIDVTLVVSVQVARITMIIVITRLVSNLMGPEQLLSNMSPSKSPDDGSKQQTGDDT